jgi:predicted DNA-binding protein (MmcQ/YjbR family)
MEPSMARSVPSADPEHPALVRLRKLCLDLPETRERNSWGHPNFRAGKRTFVAFEWFKGRPSIAFRLNSTDIHPLLRRTQFFITPYGRGRWVSLWVDGRVSWRLVRELVQRSYRLVALKRMISAL